jgi:inorganic pyrophosphatase
MAGMDVFRSTDESVQAFASVRLSVAGSQPSDGYWRTSEVMKKGAVKSFTNEHVPVLIEVKSGSPNKYELEKDNGQMVLDRVLHSAVFYPGDYGYVPQTLCGDGDPLDVLIVMPPECGVMQGLDPGIICLCRIVGLMDMKDESGHDEKVLAVLDDPRFDHITELEHIDAHLRKEIEHFFENYKKLEIKNGKQKWAQVLGWGSKAKALEVLADSRASYSKKEGTAKKLHPFVKVPVCPNLLHVEQHKFHAFAGDARTRDVAFPGDTKVERNIIAYVNVAKGSMHSYVYRTDTTYRHYKYSLDMPYPGDYGWICQTWGEESKKPIEVLILSNQPMVPESLADVRVIGALQRSFHPSSGAAKISEYKIIGTVVNDPRMASITELADLPKGVVRHVKNFFRITNEVAGCTGYQDTADLNADMAMGVIRDAHTCYLAHFSDRTVHNAANLQCLPWNPVKEDGSREYPAIIECPARSSVRYLFDPIYGALRYVSPLATAAHWPFNLGFIPQTVAEHGRPVEVCVMSSVPLASKCVTEVRIIGGAGTQCEYGPDTKVIAVPKSEPRMREWKHINDVPKHVKDEIVQFFNAYRDLEESWKFSRFERWLDPEETTRYMNTSHERFFIFTLPMQRVEAKLQAVLQENAELKARLGHVNGVNGK